MAYTIADVVNEYLIESGESQASKFARLYQIAVAGYRKFNLNSSGIVKIKELTINDNDTADLPPDYIKYSRIALCSNGILYSLGLNNNLCLNKSFNDCGTPVAHSNDVVIGTTLGISGSNIIANGFFGNMFIADNYRNGESMGRMFGIGSDNNYLGYYRIDLASNQIQLSNLSHTSTLILEYIADIDSVDGDFIIPLYCVEPLKDWIHWKYKQRSSRPLGEQQLAHQDFINSSRLMRTQFTSSNISEWVAAFESGNQATPKLG